MSVGGVTLATKDLPVVLGGMQRSVICRIVDCGKGHIRTPDPEQRPHCHIEGGGIT